MYLPIASTFLKGQVPCLINGSSIRMLPTYGDGDALPPMGRLLDLLQKATLIKPTVRAMRVATDGKAN